MECKKSVVHTDDAPKAIGAYSQAVRSGNTLYVSGQIGVDPKTGQFAAEDVAGQARQVMENLKAIVEAGNSTMDDVLKATILLRSMDDYATVNEIYSEYFPVNPPARACFAVVGLPKDALVEIECVALARSDDY